MCVYIYAFCACLLPPGTRGDVRPPGTGVTVRSELACGSQEPNLGLLQELVELKTTHLSNPIDVLFLPQAFQVGRGEQDTVEMCRDAGSEESGIYFGVRDLELE